VIIQDALEALKISSSSTIEEPAEPVLRELSLRACPGWPFMLNSSMMPYTLRTNWPSMFIGHHAQRNIMLRGHPHAYLIWLPCVCTLQVQCQRSVSGRSDSGPCEGQLAQIRTQPSVGQAFGRREGSCHGPQV
jgi:hypothetical protein